MCGSAERRMRRSYDEPHAARHVGAHARPRLAAHAPPGTHQLFSFRTCAESRSEHPALIASLRTVPTTLRRTSLYERHVNAGAKLVEFAQCMRSHGIKNFPDPVNGAFSFSGVGPDSVDPSSPAFQAAKAACIHLVPGEAQRLAVTAQDLAAGDKLAACMRSHGFPAFPDPTSQNVFDVPKSINIALPGYQSAFSTCQSQAHDSNGVFPGAASNGQGS